MAEEFSIRLDNGEAPPEWAHRYRALEYPPYGYTTDVIAFSLGEAPGTLEALFVERAHEPFAGMTAWPGGFVEARTDRNARAAALRELSQETGQLEPAYIEDLRTYDENGRDPRQYAGYEEGGRWILTGARVVSQAHLALFPTRPGRPIRPAPGEDARRAFRDSVYAYLPWEDQRSEAGRRSLSRIVAQLERWAREEGGTHAEERLARIAYAFGTATEWNEERASDRYALLYEAGLVEESLRNRWGEIPVAARPSRSTYGHALAFDHRQMLADALSRLRGKVKYVPALMAALMPPKFTLTELQLAFEAIGGRTLHKQNFRRVVAQSQSFRIVESTGEKGPGGQTGPAARLYRFPADTPLRRLDPSIRLPWVTP